MLNFFKDIYRSSRRRKDVGLLIPSLSKCQEQKITVDKHVYNPGYHTEMFGIFVPQKH